MNVCSSTWITNVIMKLLIERTSNETPTQSKSEPKPQHQTTFNKGKEVKNQGNY